MGNSHLMKCQSFCQSYLDCCDTAQRSLHTQQEDSDECKPCIYPPDNFSDEPHGDNEQTILCNSMESTNSLAHSISSTLSIVIATQVEDSLTDVHELKRTSPGTVFAPPFKHFRTVPSSTNSLPTKSRSFVDFLSRKILSPFIGKQESHEKEDDSSAHDVLSLARLFLLQDDSEKRSMKNDQVLIYNKSHNNVPQISHDINSNNHTNVAIDSIHPQDYGTDFSCKDHEYANKIDLFIRTRSNFDTRSPLSFSIKLSVLIREFLLLDTKVAFSDNILSAKGIATLVQRHPRFILSKDKKKITLSFATPFQQSLLSLQDPNSTDSASQQPIMVYGYFLCSVCKRRWESGISWQDTWQRCRHCLACIYPYDQHMPISRDKILRKLSPLHSHSSYPHQTSKESSHNSSDYTMKSISIKNNNQQMDAINVDDNDYDLEFATKYQVSHFDFNENDENKFYNSNTTMVEEQDHEADDSDNSSDLLAVDVFSLRDNIEKHQRQWCQRCIELGHLCILYRHYSL